MIRILAPLSFTLPLLAGLPSQQEALALAFPGAVLGRAEHHLSPAQAEQVRQLAGSALPGPSVVCYEARAHGNLVGRAFFDTHRVRTQTETAMVAVGPDGQVLRVEVIAFNEPAEYLPRAAWVKQLAGRKLDPELSLKRSIHPLSGATLTAEALTEASRRALALHQVLYGGRP